MNRPIRIFQATVAARALTPLLIGVTGPSGSGKTYSSLRLATGIHRVAGGELFMIDTEARRGLHYASDFKFRHIDMAAPFGPLDYLDAIRFAVKEGAKVIVVDSMSHEHSGEGGVLDQSEQILETKSPEQRDKWLMNSLVEAKKQRKKLNRSIEQLGRVGVHMVLCYRAVDKIKPVPGQAPRKLGWQPDTTSTLMYEMTQRFLLTPGADGCPSVNPQIAEEKVLVKNPAQFRGWFAPNEPLSEAMGERMARWATGETMSAPGSTSAAKPPVAAPARLPPMFRPRIEWEGQAEWSDKPFSEAPLEALQVYFEAVDALSKQRNMRDHVREQLRDHLGDVATAMAALEPPIEEAI